MNSRHISSWFPFPLSLPFFSSLFPHHTLPVLYITIRISPPRLSLPLSSCITLTSPRKERKAHSWLPFPSPSYQPLSSPRLPTHRVTRSMTSGTQSCGVTDRLKEGSGLGEEGRKEGGRNRTFDQAKMESMGRFSAPASP